MVDYCVQADMEKYLNIHLDNDADPAVALWISAASEKIDEYCQQDFSPHTDQEEDYNGKGMWGNEEWQRHNTLQLKNWPVIDITIVVDNTNTLTEGEDYEIFPEKALIMLTPPSRYFKKKIKGIQVTYSYGYATVPKGIADVCTWLVANAFEKRLKFSEAGPAQSINIEGHTVSFPLIEDLPPHLLATLNLYVKWGGLA